MRNPFASKNPFMSLWLSSANKVMISARGKAAAELKRSVGTAQTEAASQVVDFWGGKSNPRPKAWNKPV